MNPGILKQRIKIYRPPNAETDLDEAGQPTKNPIHVMELWAGIFPLRGRQIESAKQYHPDVTTQLKLRYREDLDETMFAINGNKKFEFLYLLYDYQNKKELNIYAKEVKNV